MAIDSTPKDSCVTLAACDMGVVYPPPTLHLVIYPNPQCQSLVRYRVQVLLECQFEVGLCLELAALIDFRAPGIVAVVVPTPFVTFVVIVIMIPTTATTVTEQNNIEN